MAYKKIGFDAGLMSLRGTHVAIFDYALNNQKILGNESVIFYDRRSSQVQPLVFEKFNQEFELIPYDLFSDLSPHIDRGLIDAMYLIKSGELDQYLVPELPNLVHAVFPQKVQEIHGDVYAFVSQWLSKECSNGKIPFVPHIIHPPLESGDLRNQLAIPNDAVVFGCYGGSDSFNIGFVKKVIAEVTSEKAMIYFIFMNIDRFIDHPQVIFLPGNADPKFKSQFIHSCDAMIHARGIGESFGLACGEFSVHNKPVITYALSPQRNHIEALGGKAILYKGAQDLRKIFLNFDRSWYRQKNWDCYSANYSPQAVMSKFSAVFLDSQATKSSDIQINVMDNAMVQSRRLRKKIRSLSRKLF